MGIKAAVGLPAPAGIALLGSGAAAPAQADPPGTLALATPAHSIAVSAGSVFYPDGDGRADTWSIAFPVSKALPFCTVVP